MYALVRSEKKIRFLTDFTLDKVHSRHRANSVSSQDNGAGMSVKALGKLPVGVDEELIIEETPMKPGHFIPTDDWVNFSVNWAFYIC